MKNEIFFWKRIIQKYTDNIKHFKQSWKAVLYKAGLDHTRELAYAVNAFFSDHFLQCEDNKPDEICDHRKVSYSPLQISTETGNLELCKFILEKTATL